MKAMAKKDLLNISPKTTVITIVGRLDPQKRPTLVPDIADALRRIGNYKEGDFVIIMLGDGDKKDEVKERIGQFHVDRFVRVLGTVEHPETYLAATDIFLLPSMSEGISIAVAEAMAMGLPIVTARAGALPEQLGDTLGDPSLLAGVLIDHTLNAEKDAPMYADELDKLIRNPALQRKYGANGRRNVEKTFEWRKTLQGMFTEIAKAKLPTHDHDVELPNPAVHFALQDVLLEANQVRPFSSSFSLPSPELTLSLPRAQETDFAAVQSQLKAPARFGVGKELQNRCGESNQALTDWINSMEKPQHCKAAQGLTLEASALQRSSKFQCGAWCVSSPFPPPDLHQLIRLLLCRCIFDLTTPDYAGWSYNGACFTPFNDKEQGWCKQCVFSPFPPPSFLAIADAFTPVAGSGAADHLVSTSRGTRRKHPPSLPPSYLLPPRP